MSDPREGPAVRVRGLAVEAGGRRILGPLDLEVARGEHVLLVGASGSGKTTLLRAIAGLARPSAGTIELFGALATQGRRLWIGPERRGIGMLFQGGALWPHMSVARTLRFVLKHGRWRGDRAARVRELVAACRLEGLEERLPGTLSGGEKQRLGLARALACEPRLLLLDEPLGPLDAELRGELLDLLQTLQAGSGRTTIHVTHDPGEARRLATRTMRLAGGALVSADGEKPAPPA